MAQKPIFLFLHPATQSLSDCVHVASCSFSWMLGKSDNMQYCFPCPYAATYPGILKMNWSIT
jgi:hypothetical protein